MNMEEYQFQQFGKESLIDINGKIIQLKKDVDVLKKNTASKSQAETIDRKLSAILSQLKIPFFILHHGQDGSGCLECGFCAALHEFFHLISLVGQTAQAAKKCRMICQVLNVFVHIHAAGFLGFFGRGRLLAVVR